jgi:DNA-binding NarL/FixJ family response regulator
MGASAGGLAMLSIARDQKLIGARLFGASEALCSRAGALLPPTERRAYARAAEQTRSQLGAALFDRAFDEGRRASPEVSVQFADTVASGLMGERVDDPWGAEANEAARARRSLASLTEKRREILRHVAQGLELKEIATAIDRDYNTVSTQLKAVQRAFGVESHSELIVLIYRTGIADLI